jgi:phage gp36-like protein
MTYATAQDMLDRYGADEIAQRAFRHDDTVDVALLRAIIAGTSLSSWNSSQITTGNNAVARINTCLTDADKVVLGYVRARYGAQPTLTTSADLTRVCAELARFYLHDDPLREDSGTLPQSVKTWLADFAAGKVDLDVPAATSDDLVEISFEEAIMTRTQLDGF